MTSSDKKQPNTNQPNPRLERMVSDFVIGALTGVIVNVAFPEQRELELILIGSLGAPLGTTVLPWKGKYISSQERKICGLASYAGAVMSRITYQLLKY